MPVDQTEPEKDHFKIFGEISDELDADLLYMNCSIERGIDRILIDLVKKQKSKENVFLILVTEGGSADVAFKITRALQNNYKNYSIFVPGWCKSAGTLIAIGAHTIYLSDHGELGPLDIQMGKRDELNDYISGLDLDYGIRSLKASAFSMFEDFMLRIITKSGFRVTLKTSAEIASGLTQAYVGKIAEQISPLNVGETVRLMTIATEYGSRLNSRYENLKDRPALDKLVSGYSSHSFVIDLEEATGLFQRVFPAIAPLERLMETLGSDFAFPLEDVGQDAMVAYLRARLETLDTPTDISLEADHEYPSDTDRDGQTSEALCGAKSSAGDGPSCIDSDGAPSITEDPDKPKGPA